MKKWAHVLMITVLLLGGCRQQEVVIKQSDVVNITYHFSEHLYLHALFIGGVSSLIQKNAPLEQIKGFVEGYTIGIQRRELYKDVYPIVLPQFEQYYTPSAITNLKNILAELDDLPANMKKYVNQTDDRHAMAEKLDHVTALLLSDSDEELVLYNILLYPNKMAEKYTDTDIHRFLHSLAVDVENMNASFSQ